MKLPKMSIKIWILSILLVLSLTSIFVTSSGVAFLQSGVLISSVEQNTSAYEQGLRKGQIIHEIDGEKVEGFNDFSRIIEERFPPEGFVKTSFVLNSGKEIILFSNQTPEITVSEIPLTSIKTGLDLSGGARAIIKARNHELSRTELNDLVDVVSQRFNVYGIEDVTVSPINDLSGNNYILVEIAGATPNDLNSLVSQQGKFEAKIGNETVFIGGDKDIASVARGGQNSGIFSCKRISQESHACNFRFSIFLSENAAEKHASVTEDLGINETNPQYLEKKLDLYIDDQLIDSLFIGKDLKGSRTTQISISGSGQGTTEDEAYKDAQESMNELQTVLITGSLPYKLEIVKLDTISPTLGNTFLGSILIAGISALFFVSIVIFLRYRNLKSTLALIFTSLSEAIIILGIASLIQWNLDLPSIAGILATIGTGIDSQIIILDESSQKESISMKEKLKRALRIILGAYFTALVALIPLMWAGAGLLKGFAVTTIIGISVGVFITRPAFSDMIKNIHE